MTAYKIIIPGITTAEEISIPYLEAKERRRRQLEAIRRRRKEQYERFLLVANLTTKQQKFALKLATFGALVNWLQTALTTC